MPMVTLRAPARRTTILVSLAHRARGPLALVRDRDEMLHRVLAASASLGRVASPD